MPEMSLNGGLHTDSVALFFHLLYMYCVFVQRRCLLLADALHAILGPEQSRGATEAAPRPCQISDYVSISHVQYMRTRLARATPSRSFRRHCRRHSP